MTRDDCTKIARTLVAGDFSAEALATALAKAYDSGIERAAADMEGKFRVRIQGRSIALYATANAVRELKIGS